MYKDTSAIPAAGIVRADICVVGSGPAAFSLALQFVDGAPAGKGLKVVMLESEPDEQSIVLANRQSQDQNLGPCDVTDTLYPGKLAGYVGGGRADRS